MKLPPSPHRLLTGLIRNSILKARLNHPPRAVRPSRWFLSGSAVFLFACGGSNLHAKAPSPLAPATVNHAAISGSASPNVDGVNDGAVDTDFMDPGLPTGVAIQTILPVSGGKIYAQGSGFQSFGPEGQYSNFIRLNANGSLDTTFDPSGGGSFRANPFSMVVQSTGKIIIDSVDNVGGRQTGAPEVVRFNTDGTFDNTFNSLPLAEGQLKMLVQTTGQLKDAVVLVGSVSEPTGTNTNVSGSIARLGADGALDVSFPITQFYDSSGDNSFPQQAALQVDDKILVGGNLYYFGAAGGGSPKRNGILRLNADGTFDPSFDLGDSDAPVERSIGAIAVQPDGNILIGGDVNLAGIIGGVVRVTPTGAVDGTFTAGTFAVGADNPYGTPSVSSLLVQADGKIVVGGVFSFYNGVARSNLLRLNKDGSLDMTFDPGSGSDEFGYIDALAIDGNGHLLAGGGFTTFDGLAHTGIVRLGGPGGGTTPTGAPTITQTASTADDPQASVAVVGDQITYKFYVTNPGPATLTNVKITNVLPATLQFQSADNGYVLTGGNIVTYTFPTLSPNPGNPLTLTLVASVTANAIVGRAIVNNGYSVSSDATGIVQGVVPSGTTIVPALEVILTGGGSPVSPGQTITYTLNITNRSPSKIKGINVTVPVPGPANVLSYSFADASGALLSAPLTTTGSVAVNGGNLVFTLHALKPGKAEHLQFTVVVPLDVNPATAIVQAGAQVVTKTSVGGVNQFTLPDTTTPLTGQGPAYKPQVSFAKIPIEATGLIQLFGAQPKLEKNLIKAIGKAVLDPALSDVVKKIYPGLSTLSPATAGLADFVAALNPDVSYDDTEVTANGFYTVTVSAPKAATPTYIAFVLPYTNGGSATVADVTIEDRVPDGTTIYDQAGAYNESVIINKKLGQPATGGNVEILDGGRTLRFHLGDLSPGETGFVIYKVRVLGPGESGAPSLEAVLTTSGSMLASPDLSHTYIGQPDGGNITVVGRYDYYKDIATIAAVPGEGYTFEIYYLNTGSRKSKILEIDDAIPAGLQYVGLQLLDGKHHPLATAVPAGAVDAPADGITGPLVFHPPLFNGSGKVMRGEGGYIRLFFVPVGASRDAYTNVVTIPGSSYGPAGIAQHGGVARAAAASLPVTRAAASTAGAAATATTVPDDAARGKVFISLVLPMAMVEGMDSEVFVALGSLNDAPIDDNVVQSLVVTLPKGVDFKAGELGTDPAEFQSIKAADGTTQVSIDFISQLAGHSASVAKFKVTPETGASSQAPTVFPGCGVQFIPGQPLSLNTGPVNVRILTADEASALPSMQAQVAGVVLQKVGASNPQFDAFIKHISLASRTAVVSGASALSATTGALFVPLQGSPDNILALGPAGTLGSQGHAKSLTSSNFDFVFATGASTDVTIQPATGRNGVVLPAQSTSTLISGVLNAAPNNGVAIGALTILDGRGSQIINQDGNGLINQDGNGLTGKGADELVQSPDDVRAAGLRNVNSLINQDGNGLINQDGNGLLSPSKVVSNDGASIYSSTGGQVLHGGGATGVISEHGSGVIGEHGSGLVGTPDASAVADVTAGGSFNQVSSLIGNAGGALISKSATPAVKPKRQR